MQISKPILWIDDDRRYLRQQIQNLRDENFTIDFEPKIDSGRDKLINCSENYLGCILDVMMDPGDTYKSKEHMGGLVTGLLLAREVTKLKLLPKIKVVILSHRHDAQSVDEIRQLGIGYFDKHEYAGTNILKLVRENFC